MAYSNGAVHTTIFLMLCLASALHISLSTGVPCDHSGDVTEMLGTESS